MTLRSNRQASDKKLKLVELCVMNVAEATSQPAELTAAAVMVERSFRLSGGSSILLSYWNAGYAVLFAG